MANSELRFRADGSFRIMQITDTQEIPAVSPDTMRLIDRALEREKPDLVVLTGDQIKGYSSKFRIGDRAKRVEETLRILLEPVVRRDIPFAVLFGNHDDQVGLTKREQLALYQKYPQCVTQDTPGLPGCGTCGIPVFSSDGGRVALFLYFMDSHGNAKGGGYEAVDPAQIAWYRSTRDALTAANGGDPVPSLVFQHIPVPEFYQTLVRADAKTPGAVRAYRTHKNEYYTLTEEQRSAGQFILEPPSIPDVNTGELAAMAEQGDVFALYVGHDHNNCFVGRVDGIDLGYTPGCGFNIYGPGVDRAVRVFTFRQDDVRHYQTTPARFRDLVGKRPEKPVMDFFYRHCPTTVDAAIPLLIKTGCALFGAAVLVVLLCLLL